MFILIGNREEGPPSKFGDLESAIKVASDKIWIREKLRQWDLSSVYEIQDETGRVLFNLSEHDGCIAIV